MHGKISKFSKQIIIQLFACPTFLHNRKGSKKLGGKRGSDKLRGKKHCDKKKKKPKKNRRQNNRTKLFLNLSYNKWTDVQTAKYVKNRTICTNL